LASSAARTISSMVAPALPYAILVAMVPVEQPASPAARSDLPRQRRLLELPDVRIHLIFTTPAVGS